MLVVCPFGASRPRRVGNHRTPVHAARGVNNASSSFLPCCRVRGNRADDLRSRRRERGKLISPVHEPARIAARRPSARLPRSPSRYGFDAARLVRLAEPLRRGVAADNFVQGSITPPAPGDVVELPSPGTAEHARLEQLGREALAKGECALVVLAGGMATADGRGRQGTRRSRRGAELSRPAACARSRSSSNGTVRAPRCG